MSGTSLSVVVGVAQTFEVVIVSDCPNFRYEIDAAPGEYFTQSKSFSRTFSTVGQKSLMVQVFAVDGAGNTMASSNTGPIFFDVVAVPPSGGGSPPGAIACSLNRIGISSPASPNITFALVETGVVTTRSINGVAVGALAVAPINGVFTVQGAVTGPAGTATCNAQIALPSCTLASSNVVYTAARLTATFNSPTVSLIIDGQTVSLPAPPVNTASRDVSYARGGAKSYQAQVYNLFGDNGSCSNSFAAPDLQTERMAATPPNTVTNLPTKSVVIGDYRYVGKVHSSSGQGYYNSIHLTDPSKTWRGWQILPGQNDYTDREFTMSVLQYGGISISAYVPPWGRSFSIVGTCNNGVCNWGSWF